MRLAGWAVALALVALPLAARAQDDSGWPASVTGTAEVVLSSGKERVSTRLVFAAGLSPAVLRVEIVNAGTLSAVLWCDANEARVLVPGEPNLLHVGPATRETLLDALDLPFCPQELLYALRAGLAPAPACGEAAAEPLIRDGRVVGLRRAGAAPGEPLLLEFLRFERVGKRTWPRRALLRSEGDSATVNILAMQERAVSPSPPVGGAWDAAVEVDGRTIARALGLERDDAQ